MNDKRVRSLVAVVVGNTHRGRIDAWNRGGKGDLELCVAACGHNAGWLAGDRESAGIGPTERHQWRPTERKRCITAVLDGKAALTDVAIDLYTAKVGAICAASAGCPAKDGLVVALNIYLWCSRGATDTLHHDGVGILITIIVGNTHRCRHCANRAGGKGKLEGRAVASR